MKKKHLQETSQIKGEMANSRGLIFLCVTTVLIAHLVNGKLNKHICLLFCMFFAFSLDNQTKIYVTVAIFIFL